MKYILATVIPTATVRANMRMLAKRLEKADLGDGLFTVKCNPIADATQTATHYISSGYFPRAFIRLMRNPTLMYNTAKAAWEKNGEVFPLTQAQVTNRLNACTVVVAGDVMVNGVPTKQTPVVEGDSLPETPQQTLARVGLKLVSAVLP